MMKSVGNIKGFEIDQQEDSDSSFDVGYKKGTDEASSDLSIEPMDNDANSYGHNIYLKEYDVDNEKKIREEDVLSSFSNCRNSNDQQQSPLLGKEL